MRDKIFYTVCLGFVLGALVRSFLFLDIFTVFLFLFIALILFTFYFLIERNAWVVICAVLIFCFGLGIWRFHITEQGLDYSLDTLLNKNVELSGQIISNIDSVGVGSRFILNTDKDIKILVNTRIYSSADYGDEVVVSGKLGKPENFITDQGKIFDYENYLRKDDILYQISFAKVEVLERGRGNWLKHQLYIFKNKFLEKINFAVPSPESTLLGGLILGERSEFDKNLKESFIRTGTIHIIALSGYNITLVSEWLMKIFSLFSPIFAPILGGLSIILFVLMTGAPATAVRAGIMALIALFVRATGRTGDALRILLLTAVFMILWNPFVLVFDVSFQLSFLATIGVIFVAPRWQKYFTWVTKKFGLREIFTTTCAVYVFVLPFLLYNIGNLSLVALPVNFLILPFIPFTMILGFIVGFLGFVFSAISLPFGFLAKLVLSYELFIIKIFSDFPFASISIKHFPLFLVLAFYAYFAYYLFGKNLKKELNT